MIIIDKNNVIAGGAPEVILTELTLAIRSARKHLRGGLPYLDADDLVRGIHPNGDDVRRGFREDP